MAFPNSVKLSQQIEIYQFTIYDGIPDQLITSLCWGALTGIAAVGRNPLRNIKRLAEASDKLPPVCIKTCHFKYGGDRINKIQISSILLLQVKLSLL